MVAQVEQVESFPYPASVKEEQVMRRGRLFLCLFLLTLINACSDVSHKPAPPRNFSTLDLLLKASSLPQEWKGDFQSQEDRCNAYDYQNCTEVGYLSFRDDITFDQWVARFDSNTNADVTYLRHDFTRNTYGQYGIIWTKMENFHYVSPIADQYQVLCQTNTEGKSCIIEARYQEYLVVLHYVTGDPNRASTDLLVITKAIDKTMEKYLKKP
jgi:hypothetical protein